MRALIERLMLVEGKSAGFVPYMSSDIRKSLEGKGWKYNRKASVDEGSNYTVLTKNFGRAVIKVAIEESSYAPWVVVGLKNVGLISDEHWQQHRHELYEKLTVKVEYVLALDDMIGRIEKGAKQVVGYIAGIEKKQRKKKAEFSWRGLSGSSAQRAWSEEIEAVIMDWMNFGAQKKRGVDTSLILEDALSNRRLLPEHMSETEAKTAIRGVLARLERKNKIEGYSDGRGKKKQWYLR